MSSTDPDERALVQRGSNPLVVASSSNHGQTLVVPYWEHFFKDNSFCEVTAEFLRVQDKDGRTPIHQFAKSDTSDEMEGIFQKIPEPIWKDLLSARDRDGNTPLHEAISAKNMSWMETVFERLTDEEKLELLLSENERKETPLSTSLSTGYKETFQLVLKSFKAESYMKLFEAGTDSVQKLTPLHKAVLHNFTKISDLLLLLHSDERRQLLSMQDRGGRTALHIAVEEGRKNRVANVRDLLRSLDDKRRNKTQEGLKMEVLKITDIFGRTVLHYITNEAVKNAPLLKACLDEVSSLGQDQKRKLVEATDDHQCTAMHYAAESVTCVDKDGKKLAGEKKRGVDECNAEVLSELVRFLDAPQLLQVLKMTDRDRQTVLHHAVTSCFKAVKILTSPIITIDSKSSKDIEYLLSGRDKSDTVFHVAAELNASEIISHLRTTFPTKSKAVILNKTNELGESALHKSKMSKDVIEAVLKDLSHEEITDLINLKDVAGNTVLHLLVKGDKSALECYPSCEQVIGFLLNSLEDTPTRIAAFKNTNNLGGTVLEYALDTGEYAPEILQEVVKYISVSEIASDQGIDFQSINTDNAHNLTTHQQYVLTRILPLDVADHSNLLTKITKIQDQHVQELQEVISSASDVADEGFEAIKSGVYKNGNSLLHHLAEKNCYPTIIRFLEILEKSSQQCRQEALNNQNRRGETAFALATSDEVQSLLAWSEEQEGFYYLSTQPTVLVMYSTQQRPGFDEEVEGFVEFLKGDALKIDPIVVDANPYSYDILREIERAAAQPSLSALIVIYMSHGYRGYVETADIPLRIQDMLDRMCTFNAHGKPKILMVQACQVDHWKSLKGTHTQNFMMSDAVPRTIKDTHFDVRHRDVVSLVASVPGGLAIRGLMIRSFIEAIQKAHLTKKEKHTHLDIAQIFYETNRQVVKESLERSGGRLEQVCELRSTLTKMLCLTQIFRPPNSDRPCDPVTDLTD